MTREDLRGIIENNLGANNLPAHEVRVQKDPFAGWRVVVVSPNFQGMDYNARAALTFQGLDQKDIEWAELLTPGEHEWSGPLFADADLSNSPSWEHAMARATAAQEDTAPSDSVLFPSDLDVDLSVPISVVFYSVRGGVGRSTALGYCAQILSSQGRRVICVDLDLEAPGLGALFGVESQISENQGVVQLLTAYDRGEAPDISTHLVRVTESAELYLLPAGQAGAEYARRLRLINPSAWYAEERNPMHCLLSGLSNDLPFKPDVILFDSRTGISEISAPLLFDLADVAVIVFFPHPQARLATREVVRALLASHTQRGAIDNRRLSPEPRFLVSPIPASKIPEVVQRYRRRAEEWVSDWLSPVDNSTSNLSSDSIHFVPYREDIATADSVLQSVDAWRDYSPVAEWIERFLPSPVDSSEALRGSEKESILSELHFSSGTAEYQEDFLDTFVEAGLMARALSPTTPLIIGRKGVGKTAVFRRLLEGHDCRSIPITAPAPLRGDRAWILAADTFAEVDALLARRNVNWWQFWTVITCLACHYGWPLNTGRPPTPIPALLPDQLTEQSHTLSLLDRLFSNQGFSVVAGEWLDRFDEAAGQTLLLLFDGLDTGFGNTDIERDRRRAAIEGLCTLLIQRNEAKYIKFKVVLREDIWRKLRFENKSHLYGRYVTLDWKDQTAYYKIVLKQALRSPRFKSLVGAGKPPIDPSRLDFWSDSDVVTVWNHLVGERMKGGKTAFTRNWVWNRLADANADHTPRYLLQLFSEVVNIEKAEKSFYDRSIVRPRALVDALPTVSGQALEALAEEYPELEPLLGQLKVLRRTPVASEELTPYSEALILGREVGLIGIYEGTEDRVERYGVPEIYRYALGMTRKGQA